MYGQRAKISNFSDLGDDIFSFGHQMSFCTKNYKNLPSNFFMGINGLIYAINKNSSVLGQEANYELKLPEK